MTNIRRAHTIFNLPTLLTLHRHLHFPIRLAADMVVEVRENGRILSILLR